MNSSGNSRSGDGDERLRRLIADYFGASARLRALRPADAFGASVFVIDFDRGVRHYRTFGSFGPSFGTAFLDEPQVTEQSSMDLLYPAHLVFHYERLMSLSFALAERPVTALLLGVGGAAMWRFMRAYLPECAPTLVDADETVMALARRWFYLTQPVVIETAQRFLAGNTAKFDVVHVDLYDSQGPAPFDEAFWGRCIDALAPGGSLATNWADFATNTRVRPMAEAQQRVARSRGLDTYFVTRRGFRDNLIQYLPTGPERQPEAITGALERFAAARRLPDRGRGILEHCIVSTGFPIGG
jgi:spermine/spermidine synthase